MLRRTALAGGGTFLAGRAPAVAESIARPPSEKLNIAFVGVGGRGRANSHGLSSENIVALCDVDDDRAGDAYQRFPKAKKYYDFRRMLDEMDKQIDAVVVSTPDHTHFHPSYMAVQMGKHCYTEKPLCHTLREVRELTRLAAEKKVVTQMGCQRHAFEKVHRVVEVLRSGAIGEVRECHTWMNGERGMPPIPTDKPAVPSTLKWDLWLGPAAERPYSPAYVPYDWRWWWDFGTGETGNWGCHLVDVPYWAMELKYPRRVEVVGPPVHPQTTSKWMTSRLEFPARGEKPPFTLHFHHSKEPPRAWKEYNIRGDEGRSNLFIGSKGQLLSHFHDYKLYPEKDFADFEPPPKSIPDSPGFYNEWLRATKGDKTPPTCGFDYSGPLTEVILLGNTSYRAGKSFDWDGENFQASEMEALAPYMSSEFRKGWEV